MITVPVRCVVDASVAIKLVIQEAETPLAQALFQHLKLDANAQFFAPELIDLECGNILWKQVQRSLLTLAEAQAKFADLRVLQLQRVPVAGLSERAFELALAYKITTYDACYLVASERYSAPVITADARMANKLVSSPYSVLLLGTLSIPAPPAPPTP